MTTGFGYAFAKVARLTGITFHPATQIFAAAGFRVAASACGAVDGIAWIGVAERSAGISRYAGEEFSALALVARQGAVTGKAKVVARTTRVVIDPIVAIVVNAITGFRRRGTTAATGIEQALVSGAVAVIVPAITHFFDRSCGVDALREKTIFATELWLEFTTLGIAPASADQTFTDVSNL